MRGGRPSCGPTVRGRASRRIGPPFGSGPTSRARTGVAAGAGSLRRTITTPRTRLGAPWDSDQPHGLADAIAIDLGGPASSTGPRTHYPADPTNDRTRPVPRTP